MKGDGVAAFGSVLPTCRPPRAGRSPWEIGSRPPRAGRLPRMLMTSDCDFEPETYASLMTSDCVPRMLLTMLLAPAQPLKTSDCLPDDV